MRTSFLLSSLAALLMITAVACGDDDDDTTIDGSTPTIDSSGGAFDCAAYCTTITANCTGDNAQYGTTPDACPTTCATWAAGTEGETSGNTLGCHLYHAGAAADAPGTHCIHAGPSGGGMCGASPCEDFCALVEAACEGEANPYADNAACLTACADYATEPAFSAATTSGDTFACRLYHATAASALPDPHCGHVGPDTGKGFPCTDP
jgi:hypothetical protein